MRKKHGSPTHQKKTHQAISFQNVLSTGFTPKLKLRIRRSKKNSESESETESSQNSPQKNLKRLFSVILLTGLMNKYVQSSSPVF